VSPALVLGLLLVLGSSGCLSLPEPPQATARSAVGDAAPVFTLARTGPSPGRLCLDDLTRESAVVLVFYRGEW
jgi:hypothetical protein